MSRPTPTLTRIAVDDDYRARMVTDVREGLSATPRTLPPRYFYDAVGYDLFEQITRLAEHYRTRTETAILEAVAGDVVATRMADAGLALRRFDTDARGWFGLALASRR